MISKFAFVNSSSKNYEEKNYFDTCKIIINGNYIDIVDSWKILETYLYYEFVLELISGRIISLSKKKSSNYENQITSLNSIQNEIVNFKNVYLLTILYQVFENCSDISAGSNAVKETALEHLWYYIIKSDTEDIIPKVSIEEAQNIKSYFDNNKDKFEKCIANMKIEWEEILNRYSKVKEE